MNESRKDIDQYFMKIAYVIAERSTCHRRHVAALIVKDKHILATGYNGAPAGIKDCLEIGNCLRDELKIKSNQQKDVCRATHSEQNALIQAAKFGINVNGGTMYCTHNPCIVCARMIVNAGIKKIVTCERRHEAQFLDLFKEAGVEYQIIDEPELEIDSFYYRGKKESEDKVV